MMNIANVRLGFATNSSSSHSVVLLPNAAPNPYDRDAEDAEFGWGRFRAQTPEAKQQYLAQLVRSALMRQNMSEQYAGLITAELTGQKPIESGYVDHQSCWVLPMAWDRRELDQPFLQYLQDHIVRNSAVTIFGGNDNGDESFYTGPGDHANLPTDQDGQFVARYDQRDDYWVFYNVRNGCKIRFRLWDAKPIRRSVVPELVDCKITDYCGFGCQFCYQNSTEKGTHAPIQKIRELAQWCGDSRVFEVALGGGEPTQHPEFVDILNIFHAYDVTVNFTTRSLDWLWDRFRREQILPLIGAFAYSVMTAEEVKRLVGALADTRTPTTKANIQCVMGTLSQWELRAILETAAAANLRVTLLGFKEVGRGKGFKAQTYTQADVVALLKQAQKLGVLLGVDTAFATQYGAALEKAEISPLLYTTEEGRYSAYVDAVSERMGLSSYHLPLSSMPWSHAGFLKTYRGLQDAAMLLDK